jgi:hypothetical protein
VSLTRRGRIWHYEFEIGGERYRGTTRQTEKPKARKVEQREYERRRDQLTLGETKGTVTLTDASVAWWTARGQHLRSASTVAIRLEILRRCLDFSLPARLIDTPDVERAMSKRRGEVTHNGRLTTPSTANRDIIDTLRPILNYGRRVMKVQGMPEIDWSALRLPEPKGRVREFTAAEMTAIRAKLASVPHHLAVFDFIATFGVRLREAWFPLDCLDVDGRRISLRKRKGGDWHTIPINEAWARDLAARSGRATKARLRYVWFWEDHQGSIHELSPSSFQHYMADTLDDLGIKDARPAHDLRHHAATQYVRRTGSLAGAKRLLGHENIATTARYAHASEDDVRSGLFGVEPVPAKQDRAS